MDKHMNGGARDDEGKRGGTDIGIFPLLCMSLVVYVPCCVCRRAVLQRPVLF